MESSIYSLEIATEREKFEAVSSIIGVKYKENRDSWISEIELENSDIVDPINNFLNLLEGSYLELNGLGITRNDITIWIIYGYENQCNMEFLPEDLKRLGENEIGLCISCYKN